MLKQKSKNNLVKGIAASVFVVFTILGNSSSDYFDLMKQKTRKKVEDAIEQFQNKETFSCLSDFEQLDHWQKGPVHLFVLDEEGTCYLQDKLSQAIWTQCSSKMDVFGKPLLESMQTVGNSGGWVIYSSLNSLFYALVKVIKKDKKNFILGAGFFHEDADFISKLLVERIKYYWEQYGSASTFESVGNPVGPFVNGNIFAIVIDTNGYCKAHGDNLILVGQNLLEFADPLLAFFTRKVIDELKTRDHAWVEYEDQALTKRVYCSLFTDPFTNKKYIIMAGYYPKLNANVVYSIAQNVEDILLHSDFKEALHRINVARVEHSQYLTPGNLNVMVLEFDNALIRAHSHLAMLIGRKYYDFVDDRERPIFKMLREKLSAQDSAWITIFRKRSLERVYGKKLVTPQGTFMIMITGFFPHSPHELVKIFVDDAYDYMIANSHASVFKAFTDSNSYFFKGDYAITVHNMRGMCFADGFHRQNVWRHDDIWAEFPIGWIEEVENQKIYFRRLIKNPIPSLGMDFVITAGYYIRDTTKGAINELA